MARKQTGKQRAALNSTKKNKNSNNSRKVDSESTGRGEGHSQNHGSIESTGRQKQETSAPNHRISPVTCPPKGLVNLGNTCFFNSVMQNLCRTPGLLYVLQTNAKEAIFSLESPSLPPLHCELPSVFKLTQSLLNFLVTMGEDLERSTTTARKNKTRTQTESPRNLFGEICSVSPRFRGYQQQDSQELLQALLEGLKTEEIRRRKQAILTKLGLLKKKAKDIDDATHEKVKGYGQVATELETTVDKIFRGKIVSSVLCDECGQITQVVENFLDIPLPIAESLPNPCHSHGGKKNGVTRPTKKEDVQDSDEEEISHPKKPSGSQSKHQKKKQKKQARKRSQSSKANLKVENDSPTAKAGEDADKGKCSVELDCNTETHNEVTHDGREKEPARISDAGNKSCEEDSQNFSRSLKEESEGLAKAEFANHEKVKEQQLNHGGDLSCSVEELNQKKDSTRDTNCKLKESNNPMDDVTLQLQGFHLTEKPADFSTKGAGTDFSTKRAKFQGSPQLTKLANDIINSVIKSAVQVLATDAIIPHGVQDDGTEDNGDVNKAVNYHLLGGKTPSGIDVEAVNHDTNDDPDGVKSPSENSSESVIDEIKNSCNASSSPSSGNDEKEASEEGKVEAPNENGVSIFDTPAKTSEVRFTSFCSKLPTTVSPRYDPGKQECSIQSCLNKFTMAEMLAGNNKFGCDECTKNQTKGPEKPKRVYCNASKQLLIKTPPLILTLHLKRFQQSGRSLRKFSKKVEIPFELDLSPFCLRGDEDTKVDKDGKILYRIYGVVEHCGSLSRGHYTAYVSLRPENSHILKHLGKDLKDDGIAQCEDSQGLWYHISDTSVSKSTLEKALNSNAYLLFYERVFQ